MSQSPSSAITTFSPILTRRRARDKLDSAATFDGHCKNKSTLTDTSANFTNQPHLAFSQNPLLRFKPHNVFLKQHRHISRLNFRRCHTNSPHQITNHRQILHNLSWSLETQIVSRKIISNGAIQLQWLARSQPSPVGNSGPSKNTTFPDHLKLK